MDPVTFPVPPAVLRGNDWRSLAPPALDTFTPAIPVSVVVPYYEASAALELTLAALEGQSYPRDLFEVIVVDDGSETPLRPPARSPLDVRILHQEDRGFGLARARNAGARAARHPILAFLDCDMLPESGWMAAHAHWHHLAGDLLTLGFRAHVNVDRIDAATIRNRTGPLAGLFERRKVERPEWIEFHMARTGDLTSDDDDIFRVVTGGNLGVSRWFFDEVGGFDESFDRWGMEDTEFGYRAYTLGGALVPVREAYCWHQGEGAAPDPAERTELEMQRAKVSHLIAHPDFRRDRPGRSFTVPSFVVTVDAADHAPGTILDAVEGLLAGTVHDLVVWVGERPGDPGYEWLRNHLEPDPRVFFGSPDGASEHFPASPFHVRLPSGLVRDATTIERLRDRLGIAAAARGQLDDGSRVSVVRGWALHRARRTGRPIGELGKVVSLDAADRGLRRAREIIPRPARSAVSSKAVRVLRQMIRIRRPRQAWVFSRWILAAVRVRLANFFRRRSPISALATRAAGKPVSPPRRLHGAPYPLGIDIAVAGSRARQVFAASGRVHDKASRRRPEVVLVDHADRIPDSDAGGGPPTVFLASAEPRLAVPAFDPEQVNPMSWMRDVGGRVGALGSGRLLPAGVDIDTVVNPPRPARPIEASPP